MSLRPASFLALACMIGDDAAAATPPCAGGPFREFDFWAGEWDVSDAADKAASVNTITKEE